MIDNLILAYRNEFYDWKRDRVKGFCSKNRNILLLLVGYVLLSILGIGYYYKTRSSLLVAVLSLVIFIFALYFDRLLVKSYRIFLTGRRQHLKEVVSFLQTVVPDCNLCNEKQLDEIIRRLKTRIDERKPFNKFLSSISKFAKGFIVPTIAYIAGAYTSTINKMDFKTVVSYALVGIVILGVFYGFIIFASQFIRMINCRDYDAAISLYEDLLDIQLLNLGETTKV